MKDHQQAFADLSGDAHTIRVLFVIPRIHGQSGTAYQSTGMRLVNGLCKKCREYFQIEVLSTPTYEGLTIRLEKAKADGKPFHIMQYDGHGADFKPADLINYGRLIDTSEDEREKGYLLLENTEKPDFIDGTRLAKLLMTNGVSILSLTSAHEAFDLLDQNIVNNAFESIIEKCRNAGLPGALLMPYFYETDVPAFFIGDVYAALAQGQSFAEAVNSESQYFSALMMRAEKDGLIPENWQSPSFYELAPLQIAEKVSIESAPIFRISIMERGKELIPEKMDPRLLKRIPSSGIYGRDELSLVLDQAFDSQRLVLLFGKDGTGKTCAAAEFARWQGNSNMNSDQPILYTSLDNLPNLTEVLEEFGQVFEDALLQRNIVWNGLEDFQREKLIKDVLKNVPFTWILDNFESVSQNFVVPWEKSEQEKLVEFMKSLTASQARILIISNNSEKGLGEDVLRIKNTTPHAP